MKKKRKVRLIKAVLLLIIAVCLIRIGQAYCLSVNHSKQQEELRDFLRTEAVSEEAVSEEIVTENSVPENKREQNKLTELHEKNSDLVGWLTIEGTDIDNPVMQCEDDEYYLKHDFYGKEDKYGCLYVRHMADINTPGTNFIIYGHNMSDGSMFGDLDKYKSEAFYETHPVISFNTLYEERTYEVMAVFQAQVYEANEDDVFKYYQFYQADTEDEFLYFYENVMEMSLYDTGVTAEFGDTFLTLSTCSYHTEDGRFVVVAKRVDEPLNVNR